MKRALLALLAFALTIAMLWVPIHDMPQQPDEAQYGWTAAYHGSRLLRLDFSPVARDLSTDPGWSPYSYWSLTQPMLPRLLLAVPIGITRAPVPALPYPGPDSALRGPENWLEYRTLLALRFGAAFCAALGLALIVYRLGPPAFFASALFLAIPHVPWDLSRGTGEGPLLLGFGLVVLSYGTRWFASMLGVAVAMKLTALGLWPLAFWHGFGHSRYRHILGLIVAAATWTALEPPSWFAGGPLYLLPMLIDRWWEFTLQSNRADVAVAGGLFGHYFPTRYLWPFELATLLTICVLAPRLWRSQRARTVARHLTLARVRPNVSRSGDGIS